MPRIIDHDKRREIFAEAAYRVLARKGLADTKLRDVADEAGFTTGALAHYLRSKDEVLLAAVKHMADRIFAELVAQEAMHDMESFRRVLHSALPLTPERKDFWRVNFNFWERAQQDPDMRVLLQTSYKNWQAYLMRFLRSLQEAGHVSRDIDLDQVVRSAIALIDGISVRTLVANPDTPPHKSADLIDAWIRDTLGYVLPGKTSARMKSRPKRQARKSDK